MNMKKLIFAALLFSIVFISCDEIPNEVIDTTSVNYKLSSVIAPNDFVYSEDDSTLTTSLIFTNAATISKVWFNVVTENGTTIIKQNVSMNRTGTNDDNVTYTGSTVMGKGIPTGEYVIEYYVEDNITAGSNNTKQVASHNFQFLSGQQNSPPVISNLVAPDTVTVQDPRSIIELHIDVADSNGLLDIDEVYFNVFGPGSSTGNKVNMFDDGQEGNGDNTAGDGVYSRIIEVTPTNTMGEYRFEFEAVDKVGEVSNKIIHTIIIRL